MEKMLKYIHIRKVLELLEGYEKELDKWTLDEIKAKVRQLPYIEVVDIRERRNGDGNRSH
jgi:hypothetical protein